MGSARDYTLLNFSWLRVKSVHKPSIGKYLQWELFSTLELVC
jgi:hypothetical protein